MVWRLLSGFWDNKNQTNKQFILHKKIFVSKSSLDLAGIFMKAKPGNSKNVLEGRFPSFNKICLV